MSAPIAGREKFTAAECKWLDDMRLRWQPLTEPQAAVIHRHFAAQAQTERKGSAA